LIKHVPEIHAGFHAGFHAVFHARFYFTFTPTRRKFSRALVFTSASFHAGGLLGWLIFCLPRWSAGGISGGWRAGWLAAGWLAGWLVGWLAGWLLPLAVSGGPGCPWRSLAALGCPWRLLATPGGSWRPLAASGGLWRPLAVSGSYFGGRETGGQGEDRRGDGGGGLSHQRASGHNEGDGRATPMEIVHILVTQVFWSTKAPTVKMQAVANGSPIERVRKRS
jgi:hypothetical protein